MGWDSGSSVASIKCLYHLGPVEATRGTLQAKLSLKQPSIHLESMPELRRQWVLKFLGE